MQSQKCTSVCMYIFIYSRIKFVRTRIHPSTHPRNHGLKRRIILLAKRAQKKNRFFCIDCQRSSPSIKFHVSRLRAITRCNSLCCYMSHVTKWIHLFRVAFRNMDLQLVSSEGFSIEYNFQRQRILQRSFDVNQKVQKRSNNLKNQRRCGNITLQDICMCYRRINCKCHFNCTFRDEFDQFVPVTRDFLQ